jgi:PIN domain nuclease of toxin-antitoxin system
MTSVNLCEVPGRFARDGHDPYDVLRRLQASPIEFVPFDQGLAAAAASLIMASREHGLSLGDRSCLALARERGIPVLTADRAWLQLDLGLDIRCVR